MWSNTVRGAQFLEVTVPRLIAAIEKVAAALNKGPEESRRVKVPGIESMLDLSTEHLPEDLDWGGIRVVDHEYGWVIFMTDREEADIPDWLEPIWQYAKKNKCLLINFDTDGHIIPEIKELQ